MKKVLLSCIVISLLLCPIYGGDFANKRVIKKIEKHSVGIATIYAMDNEEYVRRMGQKGIAIKVPLASNSDRFKLIAYIGAGTVIGDNYVVSVRHLFAHSENTLGVNIWVFTKGGKKAVQADLISISSGAEFRDDYALIKPREDLGLRGVRVAKRSVKTGDKVIFVGSSGASAFLMRFGYLMNYKHFFQRGEEDGQLHLSHWEEYEYLCVTPGAPGDSGGGIFNTKGELTGIMYCGISVYGTHYIFSNPLKMLKDFLKGTPGRKALEYEYNNE